MPKPFVSRLTLVLAAMVSPSVVLAETANAEDYQIETLAQGLDYPWSIAFLPDGDYLITERNGQLRRLSADGQLSELIRNVPEAYVASQGGLFDVVLHPDFVANQWLYLSYAGGSPNSNATTVSRARLVGDRLEQVTEIFAVSPRKDTAVHYGGRMAFLADGTLLLTSGDGFNYREAAQALDNQMGKLLRMTDAGAVPTDNPFVGREDADPYVYSYGHRNAQGLAVDPQSGAVLQHEHGPRGGDELNLIEAGKNYGWPAITHGVDYSGAYVSPLQRWPGMEQPLVQWTPSIACSGLAIYQGDQFPDWVGHALVGALVEKTVRRIDINRPVTQETLFESLNARIRDIRTGPDGAIYLLTDSADGQLLRVSRGD